MSNTFGNSYRRSRLHPQNMRFSGVKWKLIKPLHKFKLAQPIKKEEKKYPNSSFDDYITEYCSAKPLFSNTAVVFDEQERNVISGANNTASTISIAATASRVYLAKTSYQSLIDSKESKNKQEEETNNIYHDEELISPRSTQTSVLDEPEFYTTKDETKDIQANQNEEYVNNFIEIDEEQIKSIIYDGLLERIQPNPLVRCNLNGTYTMSSDNNEALPDLSYGEKRFRRVVDRIAISGENRGVIPTILGRIKDPREQNCYSLNLMRKLRRSHF
jgi:hypothetical protein